MLTKIESDEDYFQLMEESKILLEKEAKEGCDQKEKKRFFQIREMMWRYPPPATEEREITEEQYFEAEKRIKVLLKRRKINKPPFTMHEREELDRMLRLSGDYNRARN